MIKFTKNLSSQLILIILSLGLGISKTQAQNQKEDHLWEQGFLVPENGRSNPYSLEPETHQKFITAGKIHAQIYPVSVTGVLPPLRPIKNLIENETDNPLKFFIQNLFQNISGIKTFNQVLDHIGMNPYPKETDTGVYSVPYPNGIRPSHPMGFGVIDRDGAQGFTISCAECHSSNLFGKTVLGLTNRFPRANETFVQAKILTQAVNSEVFKKYTDATEAERLLFLTTKNNLESVGAKKPIVLGLDTSLAQVSLSLSRRNPDAYASKSKHFEKNPRKNILSDFPADSKPAVWWNLKYKNRWLSDGSIISGNPIFTNILWNEIGRGTDLVKLESWIDENKVKIQELTAAVFSVEAPRITDFFPPELIDLEKAKQGERIYLQSCAGCHGVYHKAWNQPGSELSDRADWLKTIKVSYPKKTFVVNVGTDPNRYLGMKELEKLNDLQISKSNRTTVQAQKGYVPPPLVGIWARWPYFHNNSVPSLCALLTASKHRPKYYFFGEAQDPQRDFDFECNGYPIGKKTPSDWKKSEFFYDTTRSGMKNTGHDEGIFLKNGKELLSIQDKRALIQFLQTL